jgi:AcrR family transcriptional regulator
VARRTRGRPSGDLGTRGAILKQARRLFGELGYRETTLRAIAAGAGVDARLVGHYFGSKKGVFESAVEFPINPELVVDLVLARGEENVGRSLAELIVSVLDEPRSQLAFVGLLRAAASEPEAAERIRDLLARRLLTPVAELVGGDDPDLRGALLGSAMIGLAVARHVVALEPLVGASRDQLVDALTPVVDHYLHGRLD